MHASEVNKLRRNARKRGMWAPQGRKFCIHASQWGDLGTVGGWFQKKSCKFFAGIKKVATLSYGISLEMLSLAGKIENPLKSSKPRNSRNSCGFKYTVLHGNLSDSRVLECSGKLRSRRFRFFAGNANSNFLSWLFVTKTKLIVQ